MMIAFTTFPSYRVPATNTDYAIVNAPSSAAVSVAQPTVVIPRSTFIANTDTPSTLLPTFNTANATTPTALFGAVPTTTPKYVTVVATPAPRQATGLDTNALTGLLVNAFNASSPRSVVAENPSTADTAIIKDKPYTLQDALRELKAQPPVSNTTEPAPKPIISSTTPRSVALEPSTDENNNNNNNKKKMTEKKNEVGKNQKGIKKPSNTDVN
jgi:hypothetical protein